MGSELSWRHSATGKTVYATIRSAARTYWSTEGTPALEALTVANWDHYDIALAEAPASSYFYVGSWPAGLTTVGWYWVDVYEQAGGSPAIGDTFMGTLVGYWDGAVFLPWAGDVQEWKKTAAPAFTGDAGIADGVDASVTAGTIANITQ